MSMQQERFVINSQPLPELFCHLNSKLFPHQLLAALCEPRRERWPMPNSCLLTALPGLQNNQERVFMFCSSQALCQSWRAFLSLQIGSGTKTCLCIT